MLRAVERLRDDGEVMKDDEEPKAQHATETQLVNLYCIFPFNLHSSHVTGPRFVNDLRHDDYATV